MGFYDRRILPTFIELAMRAGQPAWLRAEVLADARGEVIELGVGSGLNLAHYPASVSSIVGVDVSPRLLAMAAARARAAPRPVRLVEANAERLPFPAARFDSAVSTWVLCSIPDVAAALAEVRRVLRPGGRLVFIEHGRAPDAAVARWQSRLTPWWRRVSGGCHLDRRIGALVAAAGFRVAAPDERYRGPRVTGFTYRGVAE